MHLNKFQNIVFCSLTVFIFLAEQIFCKQTQKFEKKPRNTDVRLGDSVTLYCSVSGSHGDVQWTHDGTALGYDRQVPGKSTSLTKILY